MKLSNKILIGIFAFIFIYMTVAFTEIRLKGDKNGRNFSDAQVESIDIENIAFLVIPDVNRHVNVSSSKDPRIEVRSVSGDLLSRLKYKISGDTLELQEFDSKEEPAIINIYGPSHMLRGLLINGAGVTVYGLDQNELSITQYAGTVRFEDDNKLKRLNLEAFNEADVNARGFELEELSIQADRSYINFWLPVSRLSGSIANESRLTIQSPYDIQFKKDESSRLQIVNR